jgi:hypothetical protein
LQAGDECFEVAVFPAAALPPLAFPHDGQIIDAWLSGRG